METTNSIYGAKLPELEAVMNELVDEINAAAQTVKASHFAFTNIGCIDGFVITGTLRQLNKTFVAHLKLTDFATYILVGNKVGKAQVLINWKIERSSG